MRKALTILILVLLTSMLSLTAKSITIQIAAYVPERITFVQTEDSFEVSTNMNNIEYDFYDNNNGLTNPESANYLAIRAL
jgi:hypothetical protein